MRVSPLAIILTTVSLFTLPVNPTKAVQFPDGTVSFNKSPILVSASTTFNLIRVWGAKYYFTIQVPQDAGEPLQKVTIQLRQGQDNIDFDLTQTFAFSGTQQNKGQKLDLSSVTNDDQSQTITIIFAQPIAAGTTFTVGLVPQENPQYSGAYLFGVTVFPAGEKSTGLYLGVGRLQFYDPDIW